MLPPASRVLIGPGSRCPSAYSFACPRARLHPHRRARCVQGVFLGQRRPHRDHSMHARRIMLRRHPPRSSSNMGEGIVVCAPPSAAFREAGRSVTTVGKLESAKGCLYQAGVLPSMGTFEQGSCPPWEGFPGPDFHQESHGRFRAQAIALGMAAA